MVAGVEAIDTTLPVLGLPGSALLRVAEQRGLRPVTEYFIDRNYTADGRLVDRRQPDSLIHNPQLAARRAARAAEQGLAESMCTHGDTPGAVAMARAVREALTAAGVAVRSFVA